MSSSNHFYQIILNSVLDDVKISFSLRTSKSDEYSDTIYKNIRIFNKFEDGIEQIVLDHRLASQVLQGCIEQSVTFLAADQVVASSIPVPYFRGD